MVRWKCRFATAHRWRTRKSPLIPPCAAYLAALWRRTISGYQSPSPSATAFPLDTNNSSNFTALGLDSRLVDALVRDGVVRPTPIQEQAIPLLLDGRDLVGQARTGSGKTIAFAAPMVQRSTRRMSGVQALVLVPTRELAIQVGEVTAKLGAALGVHVTLLYGGRGLEPERRALRTAQVVIGTPGRTLDHLQQGSLSLQGVRTLVLDEADEMLDKGFGPAVARIIAECPARRQTALFSATMPEWVQDAASRYLDRPATVNVATQATPPPDIEHLIYDVPTEHRFGALRTLLSRQGEDPIIVFGRTKHGVKKLALQLTNLGYSVGALQGNMSQNARERVMTDFRAGRLRVLVATNVAARGLDIEGVGQVINYELPETAELFTHRVGRTGRMGRSGEAITFLTPDDASKWREIERFLNRRLARKPWPLGQVPPAPAPVAVTSPPAVAPARPRPVAPQQPRAHQPLPAAPRARVAAVAMAVAAEPAAPARRRRRRRGRGGVASAAGGLRPEGMRPAR